jgi:hypothetical protein
MGRGRRSDSQYVRHLVPDNGHGDTQLHHISRILGHQSSGNSRSQFDNLAVWRRTTKSRNWDRETAYGLLDHQQAHTVPAAGQDVFKGMSSRLQASSSHLLLGTFSLGFLVHALLLGWVADEVPTHLGSNSQRMQKTQSRCVAGRLGYLSLTILHAFV